MLHVCQMFVQLYQNTGNLYKKQNPYYSILRNERTKIIGKCKKEKRLKLKGT